MVTNSYRTRWYVPWKPLALLGGNLVVLAVLIFVFPALLAYLIAAFLLFNGSLLLAAAYHLRRAERGPAELGAVYWGSVDSLR